MACGVVAFANGGLFFPGPVTGPPSILKFAAARVLKL